MNTKYKTHNTKYSLTIGWLYPDLMNIYGDRGNIIVLQKRCEWRGIEVQISHIGVESTEKELAACDLLVMGGAQDSQQTIVAENLRKKKKTLSEMIENGVPGLYICGGFQYLGQYYKEADGMIIDQLGVLDIYTENPGGERLIGNIAIEVNPVILNDVKNLLVQEDLSTPLRFEVGSKEHQDDKVIFVGFENHGGRTRLGPDIKPLGKVLKGYGSNAEDGTEGAIYKNTIGTYFHGPILPKNPELADWLIGKALGKKYKKEVQLEKLDDSLAEIARKSILLKLL
jgi:CobQ-like glutamine amidotransferase family enzyme